ncbi:hypothetical protein HAX54_043572, partial [Datura stramonium]|nr:hypothetical protein [Datura stramonium]
DDRMRNKEKENRVATALDPKNAGAQARVAALSELGFQAVTCIGTPAAIRGLARVE